MLELLVGGGGGDEETLSVAGGEAADDAGASDGGADGGNDVLEFGLEDGVEVFGGAEGDEGVGVCEGREDADPGVDMSAWMIPVRQWGAFWIAHSDSCSQWSTAGKREPKIRETTCYNQELAA